MLRKKQTFRLSRIFIYLRQTVRSGDTLLIIGNLLELTFLLPVVDARGDIIPGIFGK